MRSGWSKLHLLFEPLRAPVRPSPYRCALVSTGLALSLLCCSAPQEPADSPVIPSGCPSFTELSLGLPTGGAWRTNPALADVNGDGYLDLAATTRKGVGPKVFIFQPPDRWLDSSEGISLDLYPCGIGVEFSDVTGDGHLDLLVADHCTGLYLFGGDGRGGWNRVAHLEHPSREGFNDVAAGDVNGDGMVDLLLLAAFTKGLSLYLQTDGGTFTRQESNLPYSGGGYDVNLVDLDGDGDLDIYCTLSGIDFNLRRQGVREVKVWLQESVDVWVPVSGFPESGTFYGSALGDVNGDGLPDLALSSLEYEGGVYIFLGTARGTWQVMSHPAPGLSPGRSFAGVALSDLNGDGHLDLVAAERRKPVLIVWMGDGTGRFTECPGDPGALSAAHRPGWGLAVGDFNGDDRPDLVAGFGSEGGGSLKAWALSGTAP